jgi:hypothetical protein
MKVAKIQFLLEHHFFLGIDQVVLSPWMLCHLPFSKFDLQESQQMFYCYSNLPLFSNPVCQGSTM